MKRRSSNRESIRSHKAGGDCSNNTHIALLLCVSSVAGAARDS